jgi:hypothetical protein
MEFTERQLEIIQKALSYVASNLDDVNDCFSYGEIIGEIEIENLRNKLSCF